MDNNVSTKNMTFGQRVKMFVNDSPARVALIIALLIFSITCIINPGSLNKTSIGSIILLTILLTIPAAGTTIVLIGGGLDFGVGAVMSTTAVITAYTMQGEEGHFFEVLGLSLLVGVAVGLVNGISVVKIGLPPMIVTMAICNIVTRLNYVFTEGSFTGYPSPNFIYSVSSRIFGVIPRIVYYALVIYPVIFFLLKRSRFGKQLYLVGNNELAAKLAGVKVNKIKVISYVISGITAAIAGMLGAAYVYGIRVQCFDSYAYTALVAVIVGGTSFNGGVGSFERTICGSLLMVTLSNWITMMQFSVSVQNIVNGVMMILLMMLYNRSAAVRQ